LYRKQILLFTKPNTINKSAQNINITCGTFKLFFILHFPTLNLHNQLSGVRAIGKSKMSHMKKTFQIYQIEKKLKKRVLFNSLINFILIMALIAIGPPFGFVVCVCEIQLIIIIT